MIGIKTYMGTDSACNFSPKTAASPAQWKDAGTNIAAVGTLRYVICTAAYLENKVENQNSVSYVLSPIYPAF